MTRSDGKSKVARAALELLAENGLAEMASALEILINESMKLERSEFLGAGAYERTEKRRGYANGFKPESLNTRLGKLELSIPHRSRGVGRGTLLPEAPRARRRF